MAKIIIALDNFSEKVFEAILDMLPQKEKHQFVGLAVENKNLSSIPAYGFNYSMLKRNPSKFEKEMQAEDIMVEEEADIINSFEWIAKKYNLSYDVHFSNQDIHEKVSDETSFADLLIFSRNKETESSDILQAVIHSSNCPLLILPKDGVQSIENIIIPLDNYSSIYSMKNFAYLFPMIHTKKRVTVMARKPEDEREMRNEALLIQYIRNHFEHPGFQWLLSENPSDELLEYGKDLRHPMLVLNNDRTNDKISLFSFEDLLKMQTIPIFIGSR